MQKYFTTFSGCWQYATNALKLGSNIRARNLMTTSTREGFYGGTWSSSFYLETPTGRLSKKKFHVTITRTLTGIMIAPLTLTKEEK